MMRFALSAVEETDAEDLALLRIAAMRESLERIGRFDPQRARERFLSGFSACHTWHILLDGLRIGFVAVKPLETGLLLEHLYVHPDFQGKGAGAWVLQSMFKDADEASQFIRVGALKGSKSNDFYCRHGFQLIEEAEWDNYYVRQPNNAV